MKAIAEKHGNFGILQIDAHCDLRKAYMGFVYSHASIMYNALNEIPEIERLVQSVFVITAKQNGNTFSIVIIRSSPILIVS
jgi:arginase family enzyme